MRGQSPRQRQRWLNAALRLIRALSLAALLAGGSVPALAEVNRQSDEGFVVRLGVDVRAAPEAAWAEMTRPEGWWSGQHTYSGDAANLHLDPRAGGCFCEVLPALSSPRAAPRGGVEHMRVLYAEEPRALRMTGALGPLQSEAVTGVLTMTLKPQDGGTRILWEYVVGGYMRGNVAEVAPSVDVMLKEQLQWLALKLGVMPPSRPQDAAPRESAPRESATVPPAMESGR